MNMSTAQTPTEHQEQSAFFVWWRMWARNLPYMAFAIPNGGARNPATGAMLKREGVTAGVPDVFVAWPKSGRSGLFLEFKRKKKAVVSPEQKEALQRLSDAGYACVVVHGWEEAKRAVEAYAGGGL